MTGLQSVSAVHMYYFQERQKIMLTLRDINQGKLVYFQQHHSHLQIIHTALDHGEYFAILSYTLFTISVKLYVFSFKLMIILLLLLLRRILSF